MLQSWANYWQRISNVFSKDLFWLQQKGKKSGDGRFIDKSRGGQAIFSDKDTFFSFQFHSINLRRLRVGLCEDNQDKVDVEKADRADKVDGANGIDRADRADRADGADRADRADRADG